jgi:hypothetical protein
LKEFTPRLLKRDFVVNKKTFAVPLDWKVDAPLLHGMIRAVISEQK